MKKRTLFGRGLVLLVPFVLLLGCSGKDIKTLEGDPATLYREGLVRFNKRDYSDALKKFEQLKSNFPDSPPFTLWAELKIGDCHFFKKEYVEAIAAYEGFRKMHPTHEEMPYVQYQIGMSYFNQMVSLDRDQTFTKTALSSFEYLVANYPPSLFTEKAKEKIGICRKRLADHEFYVGNFYYKRDNFEAASHRFEGLVEKFPKMPDEDKTLSLLGKSYVELNEGGKAREVFRRLIAEYPNSSYSQQAKKILEQRLNENNGETSTEKSRGQGREPDAIPLVKFEDERRKSVPLDSPLPAIRNPVRGNPHPKAEIKMEVQAEEEKRKAVPPNAATQAKKKAKPKNGGPADPGYEKLVDASQPIDITSDRVETSSRENMILFEGNVVARQKDVVIYADSIEAVMTADGKGVERVIATGDVKIQQGLRVAICRKAVFHNLDQKVILTGEPKVQEGDHMVSGDEIVFDIAQNRVEVKGGPGIRGKAKIHPSGDFEKLR